LLRQSSKPIFEYQQLEDRERMDYLCEHGLENSEKAQDLARILMQNYSRSTSSSLSFDLLR
jgi:hypothetical protein